MIVIALSYYSLKFREFQYATMHQRVAVRRKSAASREIRRNHAYLIYDGEGSVSKKKDRRPPRSGISGESVIGPRCVRGGDRLLR